MQTILHTMHQGGSEFGFSSQSGFLYCPRRALLDEQNRRIGEPTSGDTLATRIGSIFHALMEIWRTTDNSGFDTTAVEFVQDSGIPMIVEEEARYEAERLFRAYRTKFSPNSWGKIVGVEIPLDMTGQDVNWMPPGCPVKTGRLDLVVKVSTSDVLRIRRERDCNLVPGYWLIDYKTAGNLSPKNLERYRYDVKTALYQAMWNHLFPKKRLQGAIFDVISKAKEPGFATVYQPPLGDADLMMLRSQLDLITHYRTSAIESASNNPNPSACYGYDGPCIYLSAEVCNRH